LRQGECVNPDDLEPGESSTGFKLITNRQMQEYSSRALHYRHLKTGCQVFHLWNEDPENLFAFAFRTPPRDDTGAAHILEHSVLCGSRRFPLKDPFVVLLKSSLQTFLNAFTFPDKTVYPASSMVRKDFFNLMLVAGDAVFFPLLQKEVFMQEAHHLELNESRGSKNGLHRCGVVFNEMKGVFSSAESVVADASLRSLFPDSPYGFESGGDPRVIPSLTRRQLQDFHRRFYHPGNCRIFLYGNIPTPVTLEFLENELLGSFEAMDFQSEVAAQPRWHEPRRVEKTFPGQQGKSTVTLNWLTIPVTDPLKLVSFEVLSEILVGNEGAVLHKALLESRLGDDLSPATGLDTELSELVFTVGLRGIGPRAAEPVQELVLATLAELVERGVGRQMVQAAMHRVEFRNSEIRRGGRPYSLRLMRRALRGWLHGTDPQTTLEFRRPMDALKARVAEGGYFESLIYQYLVKNPHRSTVVVRPDPAQQRREQEEEQRELNGIRESLGPAQIAELERELKALKVFQERPDDPAVMARIPAVHLSDLRREVEIIPTEIQSPQPPFPLLYHDLHTNGVIYLDLAFDTGGIESQLLHLLPLFSRAVCGSGLPGLPYYDMAQRLSLHTGGFGATLSADTAVQPKGSVEGRLIFRVKMLEANLEPAVELVRDLLCQADFRDCDRLRTLILEMRNDLKASLVPGGSHYAALRAAARLSRCSAIEERWDGVSQFIWLDTLSRRLSGGKPDLDELAASLEALRASLINPSLLTVNVTCQQGAAERSIRAAADLVAAIGGRRISPADDSGFANPFPIDTMLQASVEALVGSMNVNFVAHELPGSPFGSRENAHEAVLAHFLTTGFLWERIRMAGGAYSAGAVSNALESLFGFSSYRDPNTVGSLASFREALLFASRIDPEAEEFEKIVLASAGKEDRPLAPGEKGFVALKRKLLGITDEQRQARRDALIDCTPAELRGAAERLLGRFEEGATVFLTHAEAVNRDREALQALNPAYLELPD
jgi:Zn-dependent M16 (insulinase) family peptidase